jgi:ABC-2 type transport system permease protein
MIATGVPLTPALLWLPLPVLLMACFALGIGLLLSTLAVFFRDIVEMYQVILTAWYFLTPIIYPVSAVPAEDRWSMSLNPAYYLVDAFREPIWAGQAPGVEVLGIGAALSLVTLAIGWVVFSWRTDAMSARL